MSEDGDGANVHGRLDEAMDLARALAREWREDRVTGLAAEVAFFAVLGFFPALLAIAGALGSLDALVGHRLADRASARAIEFLSGVLTDEADETIRAVEQLFAEENPGIFTVGLVAALWAASRGFMGVIRALDVAYDVEERRGYLQTRLTALGLALGTVVVVATTLAVLVLGPFLGTAQDVADILGLGGMFEAFWRWLRWPVAVTMLVAWSTVVFHVAPFHRVPWRWDVPGALLTAALWAILSVGMRLYLVVAGTGNAVLGTLGGVLILVVWLYLLAVGLLAGGELNGVLLKRRGVGQEPGRRWPVEPRQLAALLRPTVRR